MRSRMGTVCPSRYWRCPSPTAVRRFTNRDQRSLFGGTRFSRQTTRRTSVAVMRQGSVAKLPRRQSYFADRSLDKTVRDVS